VIVGSFTLAIGGEMGTLAATIEIFRKRSHAETWDWLALGISALATMAAFILSFAALLGVSAGWSTAVKLYGPIVLGVLAAFDAYAGFAEVGMYLSTYDARMQEWQAAFDAFRKEAQAQVAAHKIADAPQAAASALVIAPLATHGNNGNGNGAHAAPHVCAHCGTEFAKAQALSAHLRFCAAYQAHKAN
jgi:hypothetical protein